MHTHQYIWTQEQQWLTPLQADSSAHLVFAFGSRSTLENTSLREEVERAFSEADIVWCSTAGEIAGSSVHDDSLVVTAITWEHTTHSIVTEYIEEAAQSEYVGQELGNTLASEQLQHVLVFSDGLHVNGTSLVRGLSSALPNTMCSITGGLVGDGDQFEKTILGVNEEPCEKQVIAIGLYGDNLRIGYGSLGGWDSFGPERLITKSEGNILYTLDGKPALELYKTYLGEKANELPSAALLFPLRIRRDDAGEDEHEVVRTILGVNEEDQSLIFAGDIPQGMHAKLMKANFERLIDGASEAANTSVESLKENTPELALLISCIGRKLVLKERTEEETEAVQEVVGHGCTMTGFYSYGEICPVSSTEQQCHLHNQTMTITTFRELDHA